MPFTDAPGFRMYYEVHGDGFPLLLINGLGGDHTEWLFQLPEFSRHFKVITFDNRGAGDSGAPTVPYSTAQMADDAAALLSFLGISRTHVLGFSMGGMIAQEMALRGTNPRGKTRFPGWRSPSSVRRECRRVQPGGTYFPTRQEGRVFQRTSVAPGQPDHDWPWWRRKIPRFLGRLGFSGGREPFPDFVRLRG